MQELFMRRALELAQRGKGHTTPNPMVGAVLVHNRRVIGEGWHEQYGQAHAEVNCLANVSEADKGLIPESTMFVTLEPCAHFGKTPPCAQRLVQEQVKQVTISNIDPFEKVAGSGIAILRDAGIALETGLLAAEGNWINRRFFCFHQQKRPYIILKWAQSVEGFVAPPDRKRTQLSNYYSNNLVHQWRTEEDAILVGFNTALHDNPQLSARNYPGKQPLRIALDARLQLPKTHHLFNGEVPTWIFNEQAEEAKDGVQLVKLSFGADLLPSLLRKLHSANKLSLIVEGGAALLKTFIDAGLWDEARIFKTPTSLSSGIAPPKITNGTCCLKTAVADDELSVWVNDRSAFTYVPGVPL